MGSHRFQFQRIEDVPIPKFPSRRSRLFRATARFTVYCLLLQSIIPSFAWCAGSGTVTPVPLTSPSDQPLSPHWLVLPRIHQEQELEVKAPGSTEVYAINLSDAHTIQASIDLLKDIYTDLSRTTGGWSWLACGHSFTYLTPDLTPGGALRIDGRAAASRAIKIDNSEIIGRIELGEGLNLETFTAKDANIENCGTQTFIKTLVSKSFSQEKGAALTVNNLKVQGLNNAGNITSLGALHLDIDNATNTGSIEAQSLTGHLKRLHNHGGIRGEFRCLTVESFHHHPAAHLEGQGRLRVGNGINEGGMKGLSHLELYEQKGIFTNEALMASQAPFEVSGKGTFIEDKTSSLRVPSLSMNAHAYENRKVRGEVYENVLVGESVHSWINHKGAHFRVKTLELKSTQAYNHGVLNADTVTNTARNFTNTNEMNLKTWVQKGQSFSNTSTVDVSGPATFATTTLHNDGTITVEGSILGRIDELRNTGGLTVVKDLTLTGQTFVNEKLVRIKGLAQWTGHTLKNRGRMDMKLCDIAATYQFINSGIFLWTDYSLRAAHIINFGWMEQTRETEQDRKLDYIKAKEQSAGDFAYRHFTVENRDTGVINLQTDYTPQQAPHQNTGVSFEHWDNKGNFLDTSRELKAKTFTNTGVYETHGALTGTVDHFKSTKAFKVADGVSCRGVSLDLAGKAKVKTLSFNGTRLTTADDLKAKVEELDLTVTTPLDLKGTIGVVKDTIINSPRLTVVGTLYGGQDLQGVIPDLINNGTLRVGRDFKVAGTVVTNGQAKSLFIGRLAQWAGTTLTNRGILGLQYCDLVAHQQFINYGLFFWTHYGLRAAHVLNLGLMEQKQNIGKEVWQEPKVLANQSTTYKHFTVENRGTIKMQPDYGPEHAAHQNTGVSFEHWDNSGNFYDTSRPLKAKSFKNTGSYQAIGALTGTVDDFISIDKLDVDSLGLTAKRTKLSGVFESTGAIALTTNRFEDDAALKMTALSLNLASTTDLSLAGDIQIAKNLTVQSPTLVVSGTLTSETSTYQGNSLTVKPTGTFSGGNFKVKDKASIDVEGKFAAQFSCSTHLRLFRHTGATPTILQGHRLVIDTFYASGSSTVRFSYGDYRLGRFFCLIPCEILGDLGIDEIETSTGPLQMGYSACLKIQAGNPGVIESRGPAHLVLPGAEVPKDRGAKVICLSDTVTTPTLRTQAQATVVFAPHHNVADFIRDHLDTQEVEASDPLLLQGSFFTSTTDLEVRKPVHLVVGNFTNTHTLKLGPTTLSARTFKNGVSQARMGTLDFAGSTDIKSIEDLQNHWGRIAVRPAKDKSGRVTSPGTLTLTSEKGSIHVGTDTPSHADRGASIAAADTLTLQSAVSILLQYSRLISHDEMHLLAKNTLSTTTAVIEAIKSITVTARHFDHSGGRGTVSYQSGWTPASTEIATPGRMVTRCKTVNRGLWREVKRWQEWEAPTYRAVPPQPIYGQTPNSPGSRLISQENILLTLSHSGVCRGSTILAAKALTMCGVTISQVNNYNHPSNIGGHRVDARAGNFRLEASYLGGYTVTLTAIAIDLFGGGGARAGVAQRRTYGLRALFLAKQGNSPFYAIDPANGAITSPLDSLEAALAPWPIQLSVVSQQVPDVKSQESRVVPPPRRDRGLDLSFSQATQARLYLEMDHFGFMRGLSGEEMLLQDAHNAHVLEDRYGALTQKALQHARASLAYTTGEGVVCITLPPANSNTLANVYGHEIIAQAAQSFALARGLQAVAEEALKATSDGTMNLVREVSQTTRREKDGTVVVQEHAEPPVHLQSRHGSVTAVSQGVFRAVAPHLVSPEGDITAGSSGAAATVEALILNETRIEPEKVDVQHHSKRSGFLGCIKKESTIVERSQHSSRQQTAAVANMDAGGNVNLLSGAAASLSSQGGHYRARQGQVHTQGGQAAFNAVPLASSQKTKVSRQETTRSSLLGIIPLGTSTNDNTASASASVAQFAPDIIQGNFNPTSDHVTLRGAQAQGGTLKDETKRFELLPAVAENTATTSSSHERESLWRGLESATLQQTITQEVMQQTTLHYDQATLGREDTPGGIVVAESADVTFGTVDVYKDVEQRVTELKSQVTKNRMQDGLHPLQTPAMPFVASNANTLDHTAHVLEQGALVLGYANTALALAKNPTPLAVLMAVGQQVGTFSITEGWSRSQGSRTYQVPNRFNWGKARFHGGALSLQGVNVFVTLQGEVASLTVLPTQDSHQSSVVSHQESQSVNPFSVTFSFSQSDRRAGASEVHYAPSLLQVLQSGDLTVLGDVDAQGLVAQVNTFVMDVLGDMRISSPLDEVSTFDETKTAGVSINLLSLAVGFATSNPLMIATSLTPSFGHDKNREFHRTVAARSTFSGPDSRLNVRNTLTLTDTDVPNATAAHITHTTTPEIHESEHSSNIAGQLLRLGTAGYGVYTAGMQLKENIQALQVHTLTREGLSAQEAQKVVREVKEVEHELIAAEQEMVVAEMEALHQIDTRQQLKRAAQKVAEKDSAPTHDVALESKLSLEAALAEPASDYADILQALVIKKQEIAERHQAALETKIKQNEKGWQGKTVELAQEAVQAFWDLKRDTVALGAAIWADPVAAVKATGHAVADVATGAWDAAKDAVLNPKDTFNKAANLVGAGAQFAKDRPLLAAASVGEYIPFISLACAAGKDGAQYFISDEKSATAVAHDWRDRGVLSLVLGKGIGAMVLPLQKQAYKKIVEEIQDLAPKAKKDLHPRVRPINDRMPINAEYAGKVYPLEKLPPELRQIYPHSVPFTGTGHPDFSRYAEKKVKIEMTGKNWIDFPAADKAAGFSKRPEGYTWHHHHDGETMLLVPFKLHDAVKHTGGVAVIKNKASQ